MNKEQGLQNIWTMTDKPVIDMMTKKNRQSPSTFIAKNSIDGNSDSESLDSSNGPFVAVPKQFRPPFPARRKTEHSKTSQLENKQSPFSVPQNSAKKTFTKVPLLETPKPTTVGCNEISNQKETPVFKKNINSSGHPANLQKMHQVANNTSSVKNNADVKKNSVSNGKPSLQTPKKMTDNPLQKHSTVLCEEGPKHGNVKNRIRHQWVEKQEHRTVKFNFEMPPNLFLKKDPINENLKQQRKYVIKKADKYFPNEVECQFSKDARTYQENIIKWDSSLNLVEHSSNNNDKFEEDSDEDEHTASYQENIVKWDSSLNVDEHSGDIKGKNEQDFGEGAYGVSYQRNTIKWHSSLNSEEMSNDTKGEIKWTFIQEKKTFLPAKKIQDKNHSHNQINNEYPATKPCSWNRPKIPTKRHHKKCLDLRLDKAKHFNINHKKNIPRPDPPDSKDTEKILNKKDRLNNNLKCDNINTKIEKECSAETFTRQCRITEKNLDNQVSPSDEKSESMINNNTRKDSDNCESNFYPEKIDKTTLRHIEDQKKSMLYYGREMSDLIIGSHTALSMFISMFNEWKCLRLELISHFKFLEMNLKESSKKFTKYKDMLNIAKTGATLAAAVPLPHVSIAAKVIGVFTSLFSVFLSKQEAEKAEVDESNEISMAASKDTSASTELYMYGLQCGQQFEETAKLIEEFHANAGDPVIFENDSPEIATFIHGVLEYKPRHRIFYKKLHKCFQELLHNSTSEFGTRFSEPFLLYSPDGIDVIGFLDWRFRHEDFNGESVRFELQEIEHLIEGNDTSIKELTARIQNCVKILEDELKFLEGCVKDIALFDNSEQPGIKIL